MAETSKRQAILEVFYARAVVIRKQNGFQTDLGATLLLGELPHFGPDDPKAVLAMLPQEDVIIGGLQNIGLVLPVNYAVILAPGCADAWRIVEMGLSDIKKAVELADRSLGGLLDGGNNNAEGLQRGTTETWPGVSGLEAVGAVITYAAKYHEGWGYP